MSSTKPTARRSATFHGRLNMEQQRKRAKELLKAIRAGDPAAQSRLAKQLSVQDRAVRLSDAQCVIARECGFASWPQLKAHVDSLDFSRRHAALEGDRDCKTLHIRCGSDIRHSLQLAGFEGDFLEFADPFCIGPVPNLPPDRLIPVRAGFISEAFALAEADALARLQREYAAFENLGNYERLVLWFEHDSYDQLILAYLLMRLGKQHPRPRIELVAVDAVPGVNRFIGIGQLAPDVLAWLWPQRKRVNDAQLALAKEAWAAIAAPTPEPLDALCRAETPALPLLGRALRRHLRELPSLRTGLSLSEQLTLEIVRDLGPLTVGRAFGELMMAREPLPYLGDLMFWWLIQSLLAGEDPALEIVGRHDAEWPHRELALTRTGSDLLTGSRYWLDLAPRERWVGGVRVPGSGGSWCYDSETDRVVWRRAR